MRIPALKTVFHVLLSCAAGHLCGPSAANAQSDAPPASVLENAARDKRTVIMHAGGIVNLTVPSAWNVSEKPFARLVRLELSSHHRDDKIWLCHHYRPTRQQAGTEQTLLERAVKRLNEWSENELTVRQSTMTNIGAYRAGRIDFHVTIPPFASSPGIYLLVDLPWGWCDIYGTSKSPAGLPEIERILASLRMKPPQMDSGQPVFDVLDARPILGSWKAFQSRLRLKGNGIITIATDQPFEFASEQKTIHSGREISGRFTARDDLLFIVWDDNSKLNYRWRLRNDKLLLSDHQGKMTQLNRIVE